MEIMFRQWTHSKSFEVLYKKVENKLTEIMSNGVKIENSQAFHIALAL